MWAARGELSPESNFSNRKFHTSRGIYFMDINTTKQNTTFVVLELEKLRNPLIILLKNEDENKADRTSLVGP